MSDPNVAIPYANHHGTFLFAMPTTTNLVVDWGNSSLKTGWFNGSDLLEAHRYTSVNALLEYVHNSPADQVLVSSTSQSADDIRTQLMNLGQPIFVLDSRMPLPIRNGYDTPGTLGTDRIAAGVGAMTLFPGRDCIVLDLGTCLTADFISREAIFKGGLISPGVQMRLRAMHDQTAKLPLVEIPGEWPDLTATSTRQAIQSGVLNGLLLEMNGIIDAYRQEWPDTVVLACGGDMPTFESRLKHPIFAVPNLVLIGLNRILRYNVQNLQANTPDVNA